jgi:4-amino-4-deoxy-L-arabinose transferase-like glycosyltransferase
MAGEPPLISTRAAAPPLSRRREILATSRVVHGLALAVPFLVVIALSGGLRHPYPVYQSYDELEHYYGVVQHAAAVWPRPLVSGYHTWSGPLVYWLLAGLSRPFGSTLVAARFVVTVFSWATCVAAYVLFRDRLGARPLVALTFALLLALSPFFFGESFYVLTDNPTWFFVVLSLERLIAWVQDPRLGRFAAAMACAAAASLMRQVAVWLFLPAVVALVSVRCPPRRRALAFGCGVAGLAPLVALLAYWGGALPSGGVQDGGGPVRLENVFLTVAVIGLWSVLLVPSDTVRDGWRGLRGAALAAVLAAAALGFVAVGLGVMGSVRREDPYGIGMFGRLLGAWPAVAGSSVVWWVLVPLGLAALAALLVTRVGRPVDRILVVSLVAVVLSAAANTTWFQRYVDFAVLLLLLGLVASGGRRARREDVLRWGVVLVVSAAWATTMALV